MLRFVKALLRALRREPARLAVVRRYLDANGAHVGELYVERTRGGVSGYEMVGASLDTLPYAAGDDQPERRVDLRRYRWMLDTDNDFLAPMPPDTLRVGSFEPVENFRIRRLVAAMPRRRIHLVVQNRFIERVMEGRA